MEESGIKKNQQNTKNPNQLKKLKIIQIGWRRED